LNIRKGLFTRLIGLNGQEKDPQCLTCLTKFLIPYSGPKILFNWSHDITHDEFPPLLPAKAGAVRFQISACSLHIDGFERTSGLGAASFEGKLIQIFGKSGQLPEQLNDIRRHGSC